mmetsp:Transcript_32798/g.93072  ORF Transcript_32798/g.93072 Transcript_32798/m.93072 type:complete len:198 (-) Transcript_32798:228-821(-)|eukprot:CAMPEP_0117677804 /NCGR_PEP_ID=MMETSP0804-20121206/16939_1 /TAXON_ID=1074897 /ORGANISM="Tetraselmis astigmatica, Strain CCMP880" /LENGTH=197 /DNA_ID=CAMNT_0005487109 /DNA_START=244 /DNA_END=837 /DNA_ORIENTATION=+
MLRSLVRVSTVQSAARQLLSLTEPSPQALRLISNASIPGNGPCIPPGSSHDWQQRPALDSSAAPVSRGFATSSDPSPNDHTLGAMTTIRSILQERGVMNSSELWEVCQEKGMKSKRFMKNILDSMKKSRIVHTMPPEQAMKIGWESVTSSKLSPPPDGKKKKKRKNKGGTVQKLKMVYCLKGSEPPARPEATASDSV